MITALVQTVVFVSLHFLDRRSDLFEGLIKSLPHLMIRLVTQRKGGPDWRLARRRPRRVIKSLAQR